MKIKQIVDLIVNLSLTIMGVVVISLGIAGYSNVKLIFMLVMFLYGLSNLIKYLLTSKSKDYEGLYTFLASFAIGIISIFLKFNSANVLSMLLLGWITIMAIIKFIKTDYYNDRRDRMWKVRIFILIMFIVIGVLTCVSLNYRENVQVLVIGYFFFIHGVLEDIDPITKYLIRN